MAIIVNIDIMLARRKMSSGELAAKVGITPANLSILKTGKARAIRFTTLEALCPSRPSAVPSTASPATSSNTARKVRKSETQIIVKTSRPHVPPNKALHHKHKAHQSPRSVPWVQIPLFPQNAPLSRYHGTFHNPIPHRPLLTVRCPPCRQRHCGT